MANGQIQDPKAFAAFMLSKTSRTFALNIQVLPAVLRRQVLLAYLFCRMADTLEDDAELPEVEKVRLLEAFCGLFSPSEGTGNGKVQTHSRQRRLEVFRSLVPADWGQSEQWDRLLVHHCHWIFPQFYLSRSPREVTMPRMKR